MQQQDDYMNSKSVLTLFAGVAIGAAMGFAAGMLLAPEKGVDTRKKVKDKLDDISDDLASKVDDFINQFDVNAEEAQVVEEEDAPSEDEQKA